MEIKTLQELMVMEARLRNEHIVMRLKGGETLAAIATDLGVTRQRVQHMARRAGFSVRRWKYEQSQIKKEGE